MPKVLPFSPVRRWQNRSGPRESSTMASDTSASTGNSSTTSPSDMATSSTRLASAGLDRGGEAKAVQGGKTRLQ